MGDIYEFDSKNNPSELIIDSEIKKQELFLKDSVWYHGITERVDAENRIMNNGEFLVRFSPGVESKFVVSTKWNGKFVHTIIKTDVDSAKNELLYFLNKRFQFPTVYELITFHKDNQFPLSDSSGAALYKAIDIHNLSQNGFTNQRESKFRKSTNMFRKHTDKRGIPRSGSETYLTNQRYSENVPELNKSLTNLNQHDYDAPHKPKKPSFKLLNSTHLLSKLRPSNIKIRNKKLYKESGDYSDYVQVKDTENGLKREQMRRGVSLDNRSPSLFGLNTLQSTTEKHKDTKEKKRKTGKKNSLDHSVYVTSSYLDNSFFSSCDNSGGDDRDSTMTLTANTPLVTPCAPSGQIFDIYGILNRADSYTQMTSNIKYVVPKSLGLDSFVNLSLSHHKLSCCGPVQMGPLDKQAINKTSTFLLSNNDNYLIFCKHLLDELNRIFDVSSSAFDPSWNVGYRSIFLSSSHLFQRDLTIRQTVLTRFIIATIVSTTSTEKRCNLIFFWIKCADHLLTHIRDMFHFMAIFSAIFSEQVLSLRVWKLVYRQDPSVKGQIESMKEAIRNGCLLRTDINNCVPDLVQLCSVYNGSDEDLDIVTQISIDIANWSDQGFTCSSTWLRHITSKKSDSITVIPYFREMVQTETLMCLIVGRNSINYKDVVPLFDKIGECLKMMAQLVNEQHI